MLKRLAPVSIAVIAIVGALVAYALLRPAAPPSEPIQAIPVQVEPSDSSEPVAEAESAAPSEEEAAAPTEEEVAPSEPMDTPEDATESEAAPTAVVEEPTAEPTTVAEEAPAAPAEPLVFEIQQDASQARYVIDEVLRGTPTTVVGATNQVAGQIAINPADLSATQVGTILINARSFATDQDRRDNAVRNWVLETNQHEYITFTPTSIVGLPAAAAVGEAYTFQIIGDLTIRNTTQPVTWDVTITPIDGTRIEGTATATIRYADWGLQVPDVPFVANVSEEVRLELDLVATAT